ncbi:DUF6360 family protein [Halobaculum sp. MBLA0147]|uniref:DUF6360 family protein n=1 Tax=Halobaculum sp. MBLA0147 TaxID=3079934 RepID=UPI00352583BA
MPDRLLRVNAYTTNDVADVTTLRRVDPSGGAATAESAAAAESRGDDGGSGGPTATRGTDTEAGANYDETGTEAVRTLGVLNVTADRTDPDEVRLEVEADHTETGLPAHAERVHLDPDEAKAVAAALERHAERVRAADGE